MRQLNREQEERFLEFNQMLPKGLSLSDFKKVADEDQMALSDDDQDE